jgi:putative ABC transport system permease protein
VRNFVEALRLDVACALRTLRRSLGFAVVAVAMLALGIGINAAVFTVAKAALFDGFPLVHRNDRLVYITTTKNAVFYPDFQEWRAQARSFDGMALVRGVFHTLNDDSGAPETCFTTQVTSNTFQLLGVKPFLGRDFSSADEQPGVEPVVILRYEVWVRRFGANSAIVGQTVRIDGIPTVVIGIMPQGFSFPADQDLWMPLVPSPAALRRDNFYAVYAVARMADGVNIDTARAEMETIGRRLASAYPRTNQGVAPVVESFEELFIGANAARLYTMMWGAVGLVLLIITANVANLLLERAIGRSREISIRLALGAGRGRIIRQLLAESLILSILGGVIGGWIAKTTLRIYALSARSNGVSGLLSYTIDQRVLSYLVAISIGTGLLVGLTTAAQLTKLDIESTLKDESRSITGGKHRRRLSDLLVSVEMVLAVVLLASAGVVTHSFLNVYTADVGVNAAKVLTMSLYIPPERYPTSEAEISFYRDLGTRLQAIPGVESVGFGTAAPTDFTPRLAYELEPAVSIEEQSRPNAGYFAVSTGYFRTLGARIISGREFDDSDRASRMPVAIVNQRFASRNWPGDVPLGKRLRLFVPGREATPWLTVVGVVSNVIQNDRTRQAVDSVVYVPFEQRPQANMFAFARTTVPPASVAGAIRRQIYAMDPYLPVPALMPLTDRFDRAYAFERNTTMLLLTFAVIALLLASVGLYATISHSVSRRVQEIGIRVAMGATSRDILELVFKPAVLPVGSGLAVGLAVSFAGNQLLKSQLVGVSSADPIALIGASAALILSAALGCWIPARRAVRVDPVVALRHE